jgi:(2S)-methylsuccinyl-CoA dehydrogenase
MLDPTSAKPSTAALLDHAAKALEACLQYKAVSLRAVKGAVVKDGVVDADEVNRQQRIVHGLAWIATVIEAMRQTLAWAKRLSDERKSGEAETLALQIAFGESLSQLTGGLVMASNEIVRPADFGLSAEAEELSHNAAVKFFLRHGNNADNRQALVSQLRSGVKISDDLGDSELDMIREQFQKFANERIAPNAHAWHLGNELIPDDIIGDMADLGVFGVCISPDYGGLGLGKLAMCVVTEELSRAWIAAGSVGTRSEIAGELISIAGTAEQKQQWLPKIASGEVLPTAVFTEPDIGSDLGHLKTKAARTSDGWRVSGNKTWITHASRSDLMSLLVRTDSGKDGYDGLSMLLAPKRRGTVEDAFPDDGLSGSEIEVLGYRGMKEYELSFDGFLVPANGLLGGSEGNGFKQLMQTFEGARIQTAARAVGVARSAYELGLRYALERRQFNEPIVNFPRVADKLALMAVEIVMARELTYFAARQKDTGRRCDVEAGMAKLLAARVAWSNADASLQIHGGNGYAMEFEISRVLCDARILNIFEGAAEIQAHVIGRGLLLQRN